MKKYFVQVIFAVLFFLSYLGNAVAAFDDTSSLILGARASGTNGFSSAAGFYGSDAVMANPAGISVAHPELSVGYSRIADGLSDGSNIGRMTFSGAFPLFGKDIFTLGAGYDNLSLEGIYSESTFAAGCAVSYKKFLTAGFSYLLREIKIPQDRYTASDPLFISNGVASDYIKSFPEYIYGVRLSYGGFSVGYRSGFMDEKDLIYKTRPAAITGVAYREEDFSFTADFYSGEDKKIYAVGFEKSFINDFLFIRTGLASGDRDYKKISAGVGLSFSNINIDYAIDYPLSGISGGGITGTHRVGMKMKFSATGQKSVEDKNPRDKITAHPDIQTPAVKDNIPATIEPITSLPPSENYLVKKDTAGVIDSRYTPDISTDNAVVTVGQEVLKSSGTEETHRVSTDTYITPLLKIEVSTSAAPHLLEVPLKEKKSEGRQGVYPTETTLPAARTHKATKEDTLSGLSEKYYGNPKEWMKIYKANEDKIEKGIIKPGSVLIIP